MFSVTRLGYSGITTNIPIKPITATYFGHSAAATQNWSELWTTYNDAIKQANPEPFKMKHKTGRNTKLVKKLTFHTITITFKENEITYQEHNHNNTKSPVFSNEVSYTLTPKLWSDKFHDHTGETHDHLTEYTLAKNQSNYHTSANELLTNLLENNKIILPDPLKKALEAMAQYTASGA